MKISRNQIRGEALALRAFLHFDLYRLFSPDVKRSPKADGIPYNKEYGVSLPPMYSVEEVVQLVINDLKEAKNAWPMIRSMRLYLMSLLLHGMVWQTAPILPKAFRPTEMKQTNMWPE